MSIWLYLIITVILLLVAIIKIIIMKKEIKNITQNLPIIIKSDTNRLITVCTNDKEIKNLAKTLNSSLKELRRLELEYNQGNQELKRSITDISHDLRTPLTAIRGYLDLIDYKNLTSKQVEYLKIINNKTDTLIYLTEQLFDFFKTLESCNEINKREICINTILEDVICSYYDLFKENNIEPIIDIANSTRITELLLYPFFRKGEYSKKEYENEYLKVDCIAGSFFIAKYDSLKKINYFDEKTFLFYEEDIIGNKIKDIGLEIHILNKLKFIHYDSQTIGKLMNMFKKQDIIFDSRIYYQKKYNYANIVELFIINTLRYVRKFELIFEVPIRRFINKFK